MGSGASGNFNHAGRPGLRGGSQPSRIEPTLKVKPKWNERMKVLDAKQKALAAYHAGQNDIRGKELSQRNEEIGQKDHAEEMGRRQQVDLRMREAEAKQKALEQKREQHKKDAQEAYRKSAEATLAEPKLTAAQVRKAAVDQSARLNESAIRATGVLSPEAQMSSNERIKAMQVDPSMQKQLTVHDQLADGFSSRHSQEMYNLEKLQKRQDSFKQQIAQGGELVKNAVTLQLKSGEKEILAIRNKLAHYGNVEANKQLQDELAHIPDSKMTPTQASIIRPVDSPGKTLDQHILHFAEETRMHGGQKFETAAIFDDNGRTVAWGSSQQHGKVDLNSIFNAPQMATGVHFMHNHPTSAVVGKSYEGGSLSSSDWAAAVQLKLKSVSAVTPRYIYTLSAKDGGRINTPVTTEEIVRVREQEKKNSISAAFEAYGKARSGATSANEWERIADPAKGMSYDDWEDTTHEASVKAAERLGFAYTRRSREQGGTHRRFKHSS